MASLSIGNRRLVSQEDASVVPQSTVPRSRFTGSWSRLMTFDAGLLYPVLIEEVIPGDHLRYDLTIYCRLNTPLFPLFSNLRLDTHFFFVPYRLVWANFKRMMGEQATPSQSIDVSAPVITIPETPSDFLSYDSIADYFGLPVDLDGQFLSDSFTVIAAPFRAYNLIWNEWFRDQNIQSKVSVDVNDGPDIHTLYTLLPRAKSHDYFTSALPWPQKFGTATVPLSGLAPVRGIGLQSGDGTSGSQAFRETPDVIDNWTRWRYTSHPNDGAIRMHPTEDYPQVYADLSNVSGVSINVFRQAFLIQQLLEKDATGGTRYTELIFRHFGVVSPDARMQRPEYIGGGSQSMDITAVAQTAPFENESISRPDVGALGAAGTSVGSHHASYASTEHGFIIGLISVKSEILYQQGIHRLWSRRTRYDFYWPSLSGLGEQAILTKELYATGDPSVDNTVFGYQERDQEYRTRTSEVVGYFRSGRVGTLDAWHLAQFFGTTPTLQPDFIRDLPPMSRILAAGDNTLHQQFLADILYRRDATRPIPVFGTPVQLGMF